MKLAIIINDKKFMGILTKFFTGEYAYHCGWADEEMGKFYDMYKQNRIRSWPAYRDDEVIMFDIPEVTREYLNDTYTKPIKYSKVDFCLFALRPLYHLFGKSTRNASGKICSEAANDDMWNCGVKTPFDPKNEPPSPADLLRYLKSKKA